MTLKEDLHALATEMDVGTSVQWILDVLYFRQNALDCHYFFSGGWLGHQRNQKQKNNHPMPPPKKYTDPYPFPCFKFYEKNAKN